MTDVEDLSNILKQVFRRCQDKGMVLPFIVCAITPNGNLSAVRILDEGSVEALAEHREGDGFKPPMTVVVVDQNNSAAKVTIRPQGQTGSSPVRSH